VGDWFALTGKSPIPQIPDIVIQLLAQTTAMKILETYPDAGGMQAVGNRLAQMYTRLENILTQRVEGAPVSIARLTGVVDLMG
jgi:hypothetical protein